MIDRPDPDSAIFIMGCHAGLWLVNPQASDTPLVAPLEMVLCTHHDAGRVVRRCFDAPAGRVRLDVSLLHRALGDPGEAVAIEISHGRAEVLGACRAPVDAEACLACALAQTDEEEQSS